MFRSLVILYLMVGGDQLEMQGSYTTSFLCLDGSYALIGGGNLTLQYDYGHNQFQLESFHLRDSKRRHMFDYESAAGQVFIKDRDKRLSSYEWTDTGIKLTIVNISKSLDMDEYEGEVSTGQEYERHIIEVKEIFDPPQEVKITTPHFLEPKLRLYKGFQEHVFNATAKSYPAITCSSVKITWVSPSKGNVQSCQAADARDATFCPFALKETEMTDGECRKLEVYAEQYGVQSEKKMYTVCYEEYSLTTLSEQEVTAETTCKGATRVSVSAIVAGVVGVVIGIFIAVIFILVYWKLCGKNTGGKNQLYEKASQDDGPSADNNHQAEP